MFNTGVSTAWVPFKIPPAPSVSNVDDYSLHLSSGAVSGTNPSKFLTWKKASGGGLPEGAIAKEFDVCENGQPRTWWFVVWEEEPDLEEQQP